MIAAHGCHWLRQFLLTDNRREDPAVRAPFHACAHYPPGEVDQSVNRQSEHNRSREVAGAPGSRPAISRAVAGAAADNVATTVGATWQSGFLPGAL
jgi:hypothetical protein